MSKKVVGRIGDTLYIGQRCEACEDCKHLSTEGKQRVVDEFVDLDHNAHDLEVGDTVRVVLGTESGYSLCQKSPGRPFEAGLTPVGDEFTVKDIDSEGDVWGKKGRYASSPACVELVQKADGRKPLREFEVGERYDLEGFIFEVVHAGKRRVKIGYNKQGGGVHIGAEELRMPAPEEDESDEPEGYCGIPLDKFGHGEGDTPDLSPGDKVRCIDAKDAEGLERGRVYTVRKRYGTKNQIYIDGDRGCAWATWRFEVVDSDDTPEPAEDERPVITLHAEIDGGSLDLEFSSVGAFTEALQKMVEAGMIFTD